MKMASWQELRKLFSEPDKWLIVRNYGRSSAYNSGLWAGCP